jgi:hypothetical protein
MTFKIAIDRWSIDQIYIIYINGSIDDWSMMSVDIFITLADVNAVNASNVSVQATAADFLLLRDAFFVRER